MLLQLVELHKENHSTTLCSLMYLETLQYYRNSWSNVFSCLLDASKALDRVHYGKLFIILLSKKLPICIIHMLLDCYVRQESRASWSSYYTDYFTMYNGVKQGGVLSAIFFTLYLDKLLIRLKNSNIGCSINPIRSGGGGFKSPPPPLQFFALTHLILELHYCALVTFPKK